MVIQLVSVGASTELRQLDSTFICLTIVCTALNEYLNTEYSSKRIQPCRHHMIAYKIYHGHQYNLTKQATDMLPGELACCF